MIRSRRFALAAAVVILGLTACGDPGTTQPLAKQPKVIQLSNGSARSLNASAPAAASADSKMAFYGPTEFVFDGTLPTLDQPGPSWFFAPGQQPDQQRIAKLAHALGVKGEVRQVPADQGGGWAVGPTDFSGPVLTVGNDAMLSWWLSAGAVATTGVACSEPGVAIDPNNGDGAGLPVTPVDVSAPGVVDIAPEPASGGGATDVVSPPEEPATTIVPSCPSPTPPVGVPNHDEALAKAKELMTAWGDDPGSYSFDDVSADVWSASVNARLLLDGTKSPVTVTVGFGGEGAVTWASGSLASPQRGADYPTVGAATGLQRLNDQQGFGGGPAIMAARTAGGAQPAIGAPVAGAPAIAPCDTGPAVNGCTPIPTEPVKVTLDKVEQDLTMVWAADGTVWLLPAYTFRSADGGQWTVNAVEDRYLQQPVVPVPDTVPAIPLDPGVVVPQPAPGPEVTVPGTTP